MLPVYGGMLAVCCMASTGGPAVEVMLAGTSSTTRGGEPILFRIEAVNRSKNALAFTPPLDHLHYNLQLECKPPGESEYYPVRLGTLGRPRPGQRDGWKAGEKHIGFVVIFRHRLGSTAAGVPNPNALTIEGDWEVRGAVVAGEVKYFSAPVKVTVGGQHPKETAEALAACAERLKRWLSIPGAFAFRDDADLALFAKHLPALAGTTAEVPVRLAVLGGGVVGAVRPKDKREAVDRFLAYRDTLTPVEKEYADLMLGVAYVRRGDHAAARELLKGIPEMSALRSYIERESRPKDPDK